MSDSNEEDRSILLDSVTRRLDPRNNADDAYAAFMSMGDSEWNGLLRSLVGGGILQPEEQKGFERALAERRQTMESQVLKDRQLGEAIAATYVVPDYSGEEAPKSEDAMKRLNRMVLEMGQLEIQKEELEEKVEELQKQIREYSENLIPTLMAEVGTDLYRTKGGITVELKEEVRASFPKDDAKRERAFEYLKQTGDDGIVKRQFVIQYGRDSVDWANKFSEELQKLGVQEHATVSEDWNINHQTLLAFLRGKLREGANVPMGDFGAFVQSFARIKRGK